MNYYIIVDNGVDLRVVPIDFAYCPLAKFGKSKLYIVSESRLREIYDALVNSGILNFS